MSAFRLPLMAAFALAVALGATAQAEQFYKWVDEKGVTHYGTKAPDTAKGATTVKVGDTTSSDAEDELKRLDEKRAAEAEAKTKAAAAAGTAPPAANGKKPPSAAEEREKIRSTCDVHRKNLQVLRSGKRVTAADDKGEKRYLEAAEIQKQITAAEAELKKCEQLERAIGPKE